MRKCIVNVHGIAAGILAEYDSPREYSFKYSKDYLDRNLPEVCLAMPLQEEEYRSKTLFPFFFNLLSEGENRAIQSSFLHIDKDDDFGILLATAQHDTAGCVTVTPIEE